MVTPLSQAEFHHVLAETPGRALVYFTGPACGACKRLKGLFEREAARVAGLTLFEVDAEREMGLVREFEVFHLPSLFLFIDGCYHAPIHAEATPSALLAAIVNAAALPAEAAP